MSGRAAVLLCVLVCLQAGASSAQTFTREDAEAIRREPGAQAARVRECGYQRTSEAVDARRAKGIQERNATSAFALDAEDEGLKRAGVVPAAPGAP